MQAAYKPLPYTVSLEDICKGEDNTPEDLVKVFCLSCWRALCRSRALVAAKTYRPKSISEEVVIAATFGRRRP